MIGPLKTRIAQQHRTIAFPKEMPALPCRFRGLPSIAGGACPEACGACRSVCPTDAIVTTAQRPIMDLGKCLFCGACAEACPSQRIAFTQEPRMATRERRQLEFDGIQGLTELSELDGALKGLFKRSFRLRQVSAGGCNACEADTNVLSTVVFDLARFGIQFVASPRHADGLLVTGPVSKNMETALRKTYDAVPAPKVVIAAGACAISGGVFSGHDEVLKGVADVLPVDLFIPGCPPHPLSILDALLKLLGEIR